MWKNNLKEQNKKVRKKLSIILAITAAYMFAEFIGGIITNSLALFADSGHMLGDTIALSLSLFATLIATKPASTEKTYGYYRAEILAALLNGVLLTVIAVFIMYEAILRLLSPPKINAPLMIAIAFGGLLVNLTGLSILKSSARESLNIKAAFLNISGDMLGSIGAIAAGLSIYFLKFQLADPIISIFIAGLILNGALRLIMEATNVLFESTPSGLDVKKINDRLLSIPEVIKTHDLHVWSISSGRIALSVHIAIKSSDYSKILRQIDNILRYEFKIDHLTIQIEPPNFRDNECDY